MKKFKTVLATFILAGLTLTSCSSDDGGSTPATLEGKWNPTKYVTKIGSNGVTTNYENNAPSCGKDFFEFSGATTGTVRDVIWVSGQNGCSEDVGDQSTFTKAEKVLTIVGGDLDGTYEVTKLTGADLVITDKFTQSGQEISITYHFKKVRD